MEFGENVLDGEPERIMGTRRKEAAGCSIKATNIKMITLSQSLIISEYHAFTRV